MTLFKLTFSILFCLFVIQIETKAQLIETKISGNWYCEEMDKSTIQVYKEKDGYWYGKIAASDVKSNVGKIILDKFKFNPKENTMTGTMIRPSNGMEINATVSMESDTKLKVVGKKLIVTKTFYWVRNSH